VRTATALGFAGSLALLLSSLACNAPRPPAGQDPQPPAGLVYGAPPYEGLTSAWVEREQAEHAAHGHGAEASDEHEHAGGEGHHHGRPGGPFTAEQLKRVVEHQIARVARHNRGVFLLHDPKTGDDLRLALDRILDPVRMIDHLGYFVLAEFTQVDDPGRRYVVDFWLTYPNFKLEVSGAAIQAEKTRLGDGWRLEPRYELALGATKIVDASL